MAKVTYHDKDGRFCEKDAAKTVVKDGEPYKVVRQHRRMASRKTRKRSANEMIQRSNRVRQRMAMLGELTAPGWINVASFLGGERDG